MGSLKDIKACLFDMDGLLINSEDIYTIVANEVLESYGKPPLSWEVKIQMQGRPGPNAAQILIDNYGLPLTPDELYAKTSELQVLKWPTVEFLPGALELLEYLHGKNIPIGLATSSHRLNFERKTNHLQHGFKLFGKHIVVGDDPRVPKGRGKPFPDIWLKCLESINEERTEKGLTVISPKECLIFEDGVPGVQAGRASGGHVIWVPDKRAISILSGGEIEIIGEQGEILDSLLDLDKSKYNL